MANYGKVSPPITPPISPTSSVSSMYSYTSDSRHAKQLSTRNQARHTATAKRYKYLRRIFMLKQMDFEYAFWQMIYLFISPQKVYRNFAYRKQTKDQWARDDPAFLVLLSVCFCVSSILFVDILKLSFFGFFKFLIWVVFIDCIGVGLIVATFFWFITNKYLVITPPRGQDVEWGYTFDVHLNAFFPVLMILHCFQLPFLRSVINTEMYLGCLFGNSLWLIALGYYIYITFLGYSTLPFLKKTQTLLYPMTAVFIIYIISIIFGWNFTKGLCTFYKYRVL